jgi:hypothetical protein
MRWVDYSCRTERGSGFANSLGQAMQSKYTKFCLGHHGETLSFLVRTRLTQNLARLVPQLKDELEYIVATEFPECKGKFCAVIRDCSGGMAS